MKNKLCFAIPLILFFTGCTPQYDDFDIPGEEEQIIIEAEPLTEELEPKPASSYFILPHEFTAADLYGNIVTNETLGEKQVFFVHLWATWCGPCVRGMPDLAEISKKYSDSVGFLGLVLDFDSNSEAAKNIIESAAVSADFIMIDANEPSAEVLLDMIRTGFVPSTIIITKDNLTPEPLSDRNYTEHLERILS
ncbi:MAG: TlpA family protein disulfide reductase [Oscillospiraceae bacterium]|jgi:thiol-disulfide isomerase/thioredoxin|nr:TlpA family protein disulfide reductase [Oscillospiraceae bacterium]